jgi:hypothetical protein
MDGAGQEAHGRDEEAMSDRWNHRTVVVDNVKPVRVFVPGDATESEHPAGFKVRVRGAGGAVVHAYRCPVHGLFDARVERADVPDEVACPLDDITELDLIGMSAAEGHEVVNAFEHCGLTSPWAGSFAGQGIAAGEVTC